MSGLPCEVLLVEDNPADARLVRECLSSSSVAFRVHVVGDGDAALAFLDRGEPAPDLVLLDLNLPGRDGRETLEEIRARDRWKDLLVVVLTSSQSSADVEVCTRLRADAYITKPVDLSGFDGVVRAIEGIWLARGGRRAAP